MVQQRPATIAEVDKRRLQAAQDLMIAQRKLNYYIKKGSAYHNESPGHAERDLLHLASGVEQREGVSSRLRSQRDVLQTPTQLQGSGRSSSGSSVTPEKIEAQAKATQTMFENLCAIHQELTLALSTMNKNQEVLEGFPQYEEAAMDEFILKYTDSNIDLQDQAEALVRTLRDVFSPLPPSQEPQLRGMTALLTSQERGLQDSDLTALSLTNHQEKDTRRADSTRGNLLSVNDQEGVVTPTQQSPSGGNLLNTEISSILTGGEETVQTQVAAPGTGEGEGGPNLVPAAQQVTPTLQGDQRRQALPTARQPPVQSVPIVPPQDMGWERQQS